MAGLDAFEKRKTSCPCRNWNPGSYNSQPSPVFPGHGSARNRGKHGNIEIKQKKTHLQLTSKYRGIIYPIGNTAAISVPKQLRLCFLVCKHFHTQGFHLIWKKHFKGSSMEESWGNTRLVTVLTTLPRCL